MNPKEAGFLLLTSKLGNPERKPLTVAQLRTLAERVRMMKRPEQDCDLTVADLAALGYGADMARRILSLLEEQDVLEHYLRRGIRSGCMPVSRLNRSYPERIWSRLGWDAPGCLWLKGDETLLESPKVALVGSRDLSPENRKFAQEVGRQAALQGYTLVSGNARGADTAAQNACLAAGGRVISIVADELARHPVRERMLYVSEDGFDEAFSAQRALSRNRCIHALGEMTFVAQCGCHTGGTWDGTVKNLNARWSSVFVFSDGSKGAEELEQMGACGVSVGELEWMSRLNAVENSFLE